MFVCVIASNVLYLYLDFLFFLFMSLSVSLSIMLTLDIGFFGRMIPGIPLSLET